VSGVAACVRNPGAVLRPAYYHTVSRRTSCPRRQPSPFTSHAHRDVRDTVADDRQRCRANGYGSAGAAPQRQQQCAARSAQRAARGADTDRRCLMSPRQRTAHHVRCQPVESEMLATSLSADKTSPRRDARCRRAASARSFRQHSAVHEGWRRDDASHRFDEEEDSARFSSFTDGDIIDSQRQDTRRHHDTFPRLPARRFFSAASAMPRLLRQPYIITPRLQRGALRHADARRHRRHLALLTSRSVLITLFADIADCCHEGLSAARPYAEKVFCAFAAKRFLRAA